MIKRVIWFALGAAAGIFLLKKVRDYLAKARPDAIAGRVKDGLGSRAGSFGAAATDFVDRARAAMAEREQELLDALRQAQETPLGRNQPTQNHDEG